MAFNEIRHRAGVVRDYGKTPIVCGSESRLGQVFLNLIVNAAHAMEDTHIRGVLTIKSRVDGDHVVIEIADTGGGIPEAHRDRVFDAFFTTKPVGRGTGQGLAISRSIVVDRHEGSLTFETSPRGTTFQVRLPIAGPAAHAARAA
jgi:signal transduction histidine kinase